MPVSSMSDGVVEIADDGQGQSSALSLGTRSIHFLKLRPTDCSRRCCLSVTFFVFVAVIVLRMAMPMTSFAEADIDGHGENGCPVPGDELRIISVNVWAHYFAGAGLREERLRAIASDIGSRGADFIFVQELFGLTIATFDVVNSLQLFYDLMEKHGYPYHTGARGSRKWFFGQNSGVTIFSRYSINSTSEHIFAHSAPKERYLNNKGFVVAQLAWNSLDLVLVNCHLDSTPEYSVDQIDQIRTELESKTGGHAAIVAGDFNICQQHKWDQGELYSKLAKSLDPLQDQFGALTDITFPEEGVAYDHVFVPNLKQTVVSKQAFRVAPYANGFKNATDHFAVEVVLRSSTLAKEVMQ